jgi:hypothetical protein
MNKFWVLVWLVDALYFIVVAAGKGAGFSALIAFLAGIMLANAYRDMTKPSNA